MLHDLQNYDSHIIFQEIGKYNFKINVAPKIRQHKMKLIKPGP